MKKILDLFAKYVCLLWLIILQSSVHAQPFSTEEIIFDGIDRPYLGSRFSANSPLIIDSNGIMWSCASENEEDDHAVLKITNSNATTEAIELASDGSGTISCQAYDMLQDSGTADTLWIRGAYVKDSSNCPTAAMWYFSKSCESPPCGTYYSGSGSVYTLDIAATSGGVIQEFNGLIWGSLVVGNLFSFNTSTHAFTPYVLEAYSVTTDWMYSYGLDADAHNLFVVAQIGSTQTSKVHAIHDDFSTDGTVEYNTTCTFDNNVIDSADYATYTDVDGYHFVDVIYDSTNTCLWLSGRNNTNTGIFKLPLTYTGNYVTDFGTIVPYLSSDGLGASNYNVLGIDQDDRYVTAAVEGFDVGDVAVLILEKSTGTLYEIGPPGGTSLYPYVRDKFTPTRTKINDDTLWIGGWRGPCDDGTADEIIDRYNSNDAREEQAYTAAGFTITEDIDVAKYVAQMCDNNSDTESFRFCIMNDIDDDDVLDEPNDTCMAGSVCSLAATSVSDCTASCTNQTETTCVLNNTVKLYAGREYWAVVYDYKQADHCASYDTSVTGGKRCYSSNGNSWTCSSGQSYNMSVYGCYLPTDIDEAYRLIKVNLTHGAYGTTFTGAQ